MYSIKAVAQATGLTVETLRAWERRYAIVAPRRDASGRRVYHADDVLRLRRLREATERGHPIGRLARLDEPALARLLEESGPEPANAQATALVERMLDAAARFSIRDCEQTLTLAIALLPPDRLIREVLEPLLREVGDRWARGAMSIAQERLVSSAVRKHVGLLVDTYDRNAHRPGLVFATLPGERHEFGLLMAALVSAARGCKVHFLGIELPAVEIARYAQEVGAAVVGVSVVLVDGLPRVATQLADLCAGLPHGMACWIGGRGAQQFEATTLPSRCVVIGETNELERRLDALAA